MKNILFIYPLKEAECLSIECLSSFLKKAGHKTDLILHHKQEKNFENRLKKRVQEFKPDFIGFSVMTTDYFWACETAKLVRKMTNAPIVFGGIHPTSCPEEVINRDFVDFIVIGEGEQAFLELVENPEKRDIKNVWLKKNKKIIKNPLRPLIQDLDSLPLPDKQLFLKEAQYFRDLYICMTDRGCPFSCTYCFNCYMKKLYKGEKWVRKRSIEKVIEELKIAKQQIKPKHILFIDDCFTNHKGWLLKFLKRYKQEINIPFKALTHPFFIDNEIISALKHARCISVEFGVQTPIESIRKQICNRTESNELLKEKINKVKMQKIHVQISHIFGLPSMKIEDYKKGIQFYIDIKPSKINLFWLQYYPKTEIVEIGKKYNTLNDNTLNETIKGNITWEENEKKIKSNPEIASISRFFCWIPVLPRGISRYILRRKLYPKLFFTDKLNIIPNVITHLSSFNEMLTVLRVIKRRIMMKEYLTKLNKEGA